MKISEALKEASKEIGKKEADILLGYLLDLSRVELILRSDEKLTHEQLNSFKNLVKRAKNSEPIEYITQRVSFYSHEFYISSGALIPRPESEILVDKVLEVAKEFKNPKIAEIGVGSGILSIMIALLNKDASITATDISKDALKIASKNISKFRVDKRIKLINTPYLHKINDSFDIIVSNPPYIQNGVKLEKNIYYEPKIALFGGKRGDEILKEIIDLSIKRGVKYLCCEMGYDQKDSLKEYMRKLGIKDIEFYKDLSGFDRGFVARIS